jgi:lysozyme
MPISPPLQYTNAAFTESFEGCKLVAYWDNMGQCWTIGWGETEGVSEGMVWTQEQADARLLAKLQKIAAHICARWSSPIQPDQDEFNPLVDMAYNDGEPALFTSTLWHNILIGDFTSALAQFDRWDMAGGKVVGGLLRRCEGRTAEFAKGMQEQENGAAPIAALPQDQPGATISDGDVNAALASVGDIGNAPT